MKKYTLQELKTEKIAIHTPTQEIYDALMKKFEEKEIYLPHTNVFANDFQENTNIFIEKEIGLNAAHTNYFDPITGGSDCHYTIITPDQIDWGEDNKTDAVQVIQIDKNVPIGQALKALLPPQPKQSKTPAVFIKAQKDWNGFKAFLKEVEAYGRTLTGAQLKAYMAKERKLRRGK